MSVIFPEYVSAMIARLRECGYSAYAVGGCIRDSLIGRTPNDWDITTSALPQQTAEAFAVPPFRTFIGNGLRHGTVSVYMDGAPEELCEITTYRCDGTYSDYRRPDSVTFVRELREDLARRDFTVNAMAAAPAEDGGIEFHDPFGGVNDLNAGILRCVGEPHRRFTEDALRILRGMRFAARFDFVLEAETAAAMHELAPLLAHIAPERIGVELQGILLGDACSRIAGEFPDILHRILPGCTPERAAPLLSRTENNLIRLAVLCADMEEKTLDETLKRLAFSREVRAIVLLLIRWRNAPLDTHRALCAIADTFGENMSGGSPGTNVYFDFRRTMDGDTACIRQAEAELREIFASGACYGVSTLAITGRDLISAGIPAGPAVGEILQRLTDAVIDGETENNKEALLTLARQLDC